MEIPLYILGRTFSWDIVCRSDVQVCVGICKSEDSVTLTMRGDCILVRSTCLSVCCFSTTLLAGFEVVSNHTFIISRSVEKNGVLKFC